MPRVHCPGCDEVFVVPRDEDRRVVRCPECREKVYLDQPEEEARPSPARSVVQAAPRPPRKVPLAPARTDWLVMLAVLLPLSVTLLMLSIFFPLTAWAAFVLGFAVLIVGVKRLWTVLYRQGLRDSLASVPFYMRRAMFLATLFHHLIERPKLVGLWLFMWGYGTVLFVLSGHVM